MTETNGVQQKSHTFHVRCTTNPGETVCVSGDCEELGSWKHDKPLKLKKGSE